MKVSRMMNRRRRTKRSRRRGVATIEFAVVAPLLALISMAAIDVGQFSKAARIVNDASCEGARQAARTTLTNATQVETIVESYLSDAFGEPANATVRLLNSAGSELAGGDLTTLDSGSPFSVEVTFQYDSIRWLAGFPGLNGQSLQITTVMRRD